MNQTITIPEGYELQKVNDFEYKIVKKEVELPDSWEEFCKTHPMKEEEAWINDFAEIKIVGNCKEGARTDKWFSNLPNKEYAEAILALCKLIQLRDCYRQGWKPNWKNNTHKHCIFFRENYLSKDWFEINSKILSFQSREIRDKFYDNFKGLIEKIKPLFM